MIDDIHSCNYWCDKPACIKTQRDEFRDKQWIGLTEDEAHLCFHSANVWHAVEAMLKQKNTAQS